jgi:chromatin remodeling complex protein RSC6
MAYILLSDEICEFLDVESGTRCPRILVTKDINNYIFKNNLLDTADKRRIIPDAKLKAILKESDVNNMTIFNIQRCMKHHFLTQ